MVESRWGRRLGPGIAAAAAFLVIASTTVGAPTVAPATGGDRPPPDCRVATTAGSPVDGIAWFRLDPTLVDGVRAGQRLDIGRGRERAWSLTLESESFASGPTGGLVVVGSDDGRRSTVAVVDTARGCAVTAAVEAQVIRHAVVTPDGSTLYEFRVRRADRADLGVWRRVPGAATAERVLGPLPLDPAFGRTWLTELHWAEDGRRLVVSSCAEVACRFRVLDPATGAVETVADPQLGSLVGMVDDALVVRGACRGLPCPVMRIDLGRDGVTVLDDAAGGATIVRDPVGSPVVVLDRAGRPTEARAMRVRDAAVTAVLGGAATLIGPRPDFAAELPPGWLAVRDAAGAPVARRLDDPATVRLEEVRP